MKILALLLVIVIAQAADPALKLVINTSNSGTSGNAQFILPLNRSYNYEFAVDWGDGSGGHVITNASVGFPNITNTFANPGTFTLTIREIIPGGFPAIYFNQSGDCLKVLQIANWGAVFWNTLNGAFAGCSNLTITATDQATANTGRVTDFSDAWYGCSSLTSFPLLNTSAGTDFTGAWAGCSGPTSFPLLNTAAGTNFGGAWQGCSGLTSFPLLNTAAGTNFSFAWQDCIGLISFPPLNTAAGTHFSYTWGNCTGLTSFPLLNTAAGTDFDGAWFSCNGLTSFPLLNTSAGTDFSKAWNGCSGLISFPLLNTAAGIDFYDAWSNCSGLTSFPLLNTLDGTEFTGAWQGCLGLTSFPLLNTSAGKYFSSAWQGCLGLTSFPLLNTAAGTYFDQAWFGCTNLKSFPTLNLGMMFSGIDCFTQDTLSTVSYSDLLIALASTNTNTGRTFDGGFSQYNARAATSRDTTLISSLGWSITDGGLAAPVITSPLTASGTVGAPFIYQITASNAPTSLNATGLPAGLTVNTTTGLITGTPTVAAIGSASVTLTASNAGATLTLTIVATTSGAPVITSALMASGTVGLAFNYQIVASNAPTSFAAIGLPTGLTIDPVVGVIAGTPTIAEMMNIAISATNDVGTESTTMVITIAPAVAPVISSALVASGRVGSGFIYQIAANNSPTSFAARGLPTGLSVDPVAGTITGTPTAAGATSATISATNSGGTGTSTLFITIAAASTATVSTSSGGGGRCGLGSSAALVALFAALAVMRSSLVRLWRQQRD
jgi:hypothetical protein